MLLGHLFLLFPRSEYQFFLLYEKEHLKMSHALLWAWKKDTGVTGFRWDLVASGYNNQEVMRSRVLVVLLYAWWRHYQFNMGPEVMVQGWWTSVQKDRWRITKSSVSWTIKTNRHYLHILTPCSQRRVCKYNATTRHSLDTWYYVHMLDTVSLCKTTYNLSYFMHGIGALCLTVQL